MEIIFQLLIAVAGILGVGITLGQMLGRFRDQDRLDLLAEIKKNLECSKEHPGAQKFISEFVHKNPKYRDIRIDANEIEKVVFVGQWMGNSDPEAGRRVSSIVAGDIKLKGLDGNVTEPLCSFDELKAWSKDPTFSKWLGFSLIAISAILGLALV